MARSKAQKAHALASMAKIKSGNKENADPSSGNSSDENSSNSQETVERRRKAVTERKAAQTMESKQLACTLMRIVYRLMSQVT
jgi:hypothetical protein